MCEKYGLPLKGRVVDQNVSLIDLFPTLRDMTANGSDADWDAHPVHGRSLLPLLLGACEPVATDSAAIMCEYTSEMVPGGWFMIKKGALKFVYSQQALLLFDLAADPLENNNVTTAPEYAEAVSELTALAAQTWPDLKDLAERIVQSQRARRHALETMRHTGAAALLSHRLTQRPMA